MGVLCGNGFLRDLPELFEHDEGVREREEEEVKSDWWDGRCRRG